MKNLKLKQKKQKQTPEPVRDEITTPIAPKDDGLMDDYQYALNVGIQGKMCQKGQYEQWWKIGQILKNERGDEGRTLFVEWSSVWGNHPDYKTLTHQLHCAEYYNKLKQQSKNDKKRLGFCLSTLSRYWCLYMGRLSC